MFSMDSGVSEASIMYMSETPSPSLMDGMSIPQQQPNRRRGPVKRQSSCLSGSEVMAQTADFLAQQQVGWVQLWPANYQPQHTQQQLSSMAGPWGTMDAAYAMSAQQVSSGAVAAPLMPHHQLQASSSGSMLSAYGSEAPAGQMGGMAVASGGLYDAAAGASMPGPVLGLDPAAAAAVAAPAPAPAAMRAPQHRLPKRRASAPHLAAAQSQRVPHTGGPDCQCTQCLCARTDELCQRLLAQRAGQALAPYNSASAAAAAPAAMQLQGQQQDQHARSGPARGHSPVHGKRGSFDLPPTAAKTRRSPDSSRQSPAGSPGQNPGFFAMQQQQQQQLSGMPYAGAPAYPAMMQRVGSGPFNGQYQQSPMPCAPFESSAAAYAAASDAAAQQQVHAGAPGPRAIGSGHSGIGSEEDPAAVDRELEQLLAGAGWPLEPVPGAGAAQASMQPPARLHSLQARQSVLAAQQQASMPAAIPAQAGLMAPAVTVNGYAACASLDPAELLKDLDSDMRLPSFDKWGQGGPASNTLLPELCPDTSELAFLNELLENHPEEASYMDLLMS